MVSLLCVRDNTVRLLGAKYGQKKASFEMRSDCVNSVCFSPDGKIIVSGSCDNTVRLRGAYLCQQS